MMVYLYSSFVYSAEGLRRISHTFLDRLIREEWCTNVPQILPNISPQVLNVEFFLQDLWHYQRLRAQCARLFYLSLKEKRWIRTRFGDSISLWRFHLTLFFNRVSFLCFKAAFEGYLMAKSSLQKKSNDTIKYIVEGGRNKGAHTFPKSVCERNCVTGVRTHLLRGHSPTL